jgi:polysaccharide pyruvyl transferase WcaK-like protein
LPYILTKIKSIFVKQKTNSNLYNKFNLFEISKQSFAISIGLGPFISTNDKIINLTKELFLNLDFSAVRDFKSESYLNDWGVSEYKKYADACYIIDNNKLNLSSGIKKIGVIVRDWDHTKEGNESYNGIKKLVKDLRIKGYEVSYFVFAEDIDLYWAKYLKKKGENCIIWDPLGDSIDGFIKKMSEFDFFVTGRFHGAIFSTILRKPFITIGLEPKLEMVSELFSQSSFVWKQPYITDECLTIVEQVSNNYKDVCSLIDFKVKEQKLLATAMFDELLEKML